MCGVACPKFWRRHTLSTPSVVWKMPKYFCDICDTHLTFDSVSAPLCVRELSDCPLDFMHTHDGRRSCFGCVHSCGSCLLRVCRAGKGETAAQLRLQASRMLQTVVLPGALLTTLLAGFAGVDAESQRRQEHTLPPHRLELNSDRLQFLGQEHLIFDGPGAPAPSSSSMGPPRGGGGPGGPPPGMHPGFGPGGPFGGPPGPFPGPGGHFGGPFPPPGMGGPGPYGHGGMPPPGGFPFPPPHMGGPMPGHGGFGFPPRGFPPPHMMAGPAGPMHPGGGPGGFPPSFGGPAPIPGR